MRCFLSKHPTEITGVSVPLLSGEILSNLPIKFAYWTVQFESHLSSWFWRVTLDLNRTAILECTPPELAALNFSDQFFWTPRAWTLFCENSPRSQIGKFNSRDNDRHDTREMLFWKSNFSLTLSGGINDQFITFKILFELSRFQIWKFECEIIG